jgi:hypothetical protein
MMEVTQVSLDTVPTKILGHPILILDNYFWRSINGNDTGSRNSAGEAGGGVGAQVWFRAKSAGQELGDEMSLSQ